jgi:hypothetical protein
MKTESKPGKLLGLFDNTIQSRAAEVNMTGQPLSSG